MSRRAQVGLPAELEALGSRLEDHRRSQSGRRRLPDRLWAEAAKLAARYGVNSTVGRLPLIQPRTLSHPRTVLH